MALRARRKNQTVGIPADSKQANCGKVISEKADSQGQAGGKVFESGQHFSMREFLQRTTPASEENSLKELPTAPAIMCHVFLLSCVLERTSNRHAEHHGLTLPQWMALGCIGNEGKNGITHSDLCQRLMLSKAPVTGIVDRLVRDGYAQRTADKKDRRVWRIAIKPSGEAAWRQVRDELRDAAKEHCADFSEDEQRVLLNLLGRLLERVTLADKPACPKVRKQLTTNR